MADAKLETKPETGKSTEPVKEVKAATDTQEKKEKTTTQRLFPDFKGTNRAGTEVLEEPAEKPKAKEEPKIETKKIEPKVFNVDEYKDAKLKLKVGDVEEEATLEDVIRRAQLDKHLTIKSQKLAEEDKKLQAKVAEMEAKEKALAELIAAQSARSSETQTTPEDESLFKDDPYMKKMEKQLRDMGDVVQSLRQEAAPVLYENAMKRIADTVKSTLGAEDFRSYETRIKDHLLSLPIAMRQTLDSEPGWISLYQQFKIKDLLNAKPPVPEAPQAIERTAPPTVPVESTRGASSGLTDDYETKKRDLFTKAQKMSQDGSAVANTAWDEYLAFTAKGRAES